MLIGLTISRHSVLSDAQCRGYLAAETAENRVYSFLSSGYTSDGLVCRTGIGCGFCLSGRCGRLSRLPACWVEASAPFHRTRKEASGSCMPSP